MRVNAMTEVYSTAELFGKPALFTNSRIDRDRVPDNLCCYDIRGSDNDPGALNLVEPAVSVNHAGTVITAKPLEFPDSGYTEIGDGLNFLGDEMTVAEFEQSLQMDDMSY